MSDVSYVKDTIAARATPPGKGGIGIIRVSGPKVADIAAAVAGGLPPARLAAYRNFTSTDDEVLDQGIAIFYQAPDSFTGEDVLELQGHGSPVVLDMLLDEIVRCGARLARPGEFSERAFLNDKLDLTQAEAIADLIDSSTREAARGAVQSLKGRFSRRINALVASVIELRIYVEAAIDFPEEEIDFLSDDRVSSHLCALIEDVDRVLAEAQEATLLTEGASVVLLGEPNAGKSSLMNQLTGRDTSIVTAIPGTTRDVVDDQLQIDGIPLRLIDTAGIRDSQDEVETEGIRRALAAGEAADLVIVLLDATRPGHHDDLLERVPEAANLLKVYNKTDLPEAMVPEGDIGISALHGTGIDTLKDQLKNILGVSASFDGGFTARRRHLDALKRAADALVTGREVLEATRAGELLAEELKLCQQALSEITGEFTADDLLGEIFGSFCIGK